MSFSLGQISSRVANPSRFPRLPARKPCRSPIVKSSLQNELLTNAQASGDLLQFLQDNPLLVVAGGGLVVVPLIAGIVSGFGGGKSVKTVSAAAAYEALAGDDSTILIDIRPRSIINAEGFPDIRATGKKLLQIPFTKINSQGEEEQIQQFVSLVDKKVSEDKIVTLIDAFGQMSKIAAEALVEAEAVSGTVYVIEGGCTGFKGWKGSDSVEGLPWREPIKFDFSAFNPESVAKTAGALQEQYKKNPTFFNGVLAVAGVAGATTLLFTEVETLLEVVGVVGAIQFIGTKLLFAKDRKKTLAQFRELLNDKIAAGDAGKDLKRLADALLEKEDELTEGDSSRPQNGVTSQANGKEEKQETVPDNVAEATKFVEAWKSRRTEEKMTQAVQQNISAST